MADKKYPVLDILLNNVRLSFPAIVEPQTVKSNETAKPYWGGGAILDPAVDPRHKEYILQIRKYLKEMDQMLWEGKPASKKALHPMICFGKASEKMNSDGQLYAGCDSPTAYYVTFRGDGTKPRGFSVMDRDKKNIENDPQRMTELFYGGANVDVKLNFWVQDDANGRVPRCGFKGIRFRAHNEPFSGHKASANEFEDLDDEDDQIFGDESLDDEDEI